jgi:hypothetical protein
MLEIELLGGWFRDGGVDAEGGNMRVDWMDHGASVSGGVLRARNSR